MVALFVLGAALIAFTPVASADHGGDCTTSPVGGRPYSVCTTDGTQGCFLWVTNHHNPDICVVPGII